MNSYESVEVNAFYFTAGRELKSYPARITLNNRQYDFTSGLQLKIQTGARRLRLFNMTDGQQTYRLKQEGGNWTLLGVGPA